MIIFKYKQFPLSVFSIKIAFSCLGVFLRYKEKSKQGRKEKREKKMIRKYINKVI
jgi:hypothetical protein